VVGVLGCHPEDTARPAAAATCTSPGLPAEKGAAIAVEGPMSSAGASTSDFDTRSPGTAPTLTSATKAHDGYRTRRSCGRGARVAVKKAVTAAIDRIATVDPVLAGHLRSHIRTRLTWPTSRLPTTRWNGCRTEPPRHLRRRPRPVQMSTRMHALAMAAAPGLSEDTHGVDPAQMFTAPGRPPRDRQARTRGWGRRVHLSLGSGPDGGCRPASESGYTRKPSWMIDSATARRAALLLRA
jgi:hypothetical protein